MTLNARNVFLTFLSIFMVVFVHVETPERVTSYRLYRPWFFQGECNKARIAADANRVFALGGYFWNKTSGFNFLVSLD